MSNDVLDTSSWSQERRRTRHTPKPASTLQKAGTGVCLAITAVALVLSWKVLSAGLASSHVTMSLAQWDRLGQAPQAQQWQATLESAVRANDSYPVANGAYLDQLGQVQSWSAFDVPAADPAARDSRLAALQAYRASVAVRPTWPDTWARLATTKFALGELDGEYQNAVEQANQWGAWRPDVQLELASIGLRAWPSMSVAQRAAAVESMRKVMAGPRADALHLLQLARLAGLQHVVCHGMAEDNARAQQLCTSTGGKF
jgi:hypothetical protein